MANQPSKDTRPAQSGQQSGQPVPSQAPSAPAAPAAAAKAAPKPKVPLTPEQQALKAAMDEARRKFNESVGKTGKKATSRTSSTGGFDPNARLTVAEPSAFKGDRKALADALKGDGKTLKEALAMEGVNFAVVRHHLVRGHLKMNGLTIQEAFKAKPADKPAEASKSEGAEAQ